MQRNRGSYWKRSCKRMGSVYIERTRQAKPQNCQITDLCKHESWQLLIVGYNNTIRGKEI